MSVKNLIAEVLSAHADRRLKEAKSGLDYARLFPDDEELSVLLTLADQVRNVLKPVEPSAHFQDQLKEELIIAAQQQLTEDKQPHMIIRFFSPARTTILAATMLVTVIIGVVVKRWRQEDVDLLQST